MYLSSETLTEAFLHFMNQQITTLSLCVFQNTIYATNLDVSRIIGKMYEYPSNGNPSCNADSAPFLFIFYSQILRASKNLIIDPCHPQAKANETCQLQ